ncbi:cellulose-binding domain-containing protein [Streptomyces sp. NBC_00433]
MREQDSSPAASPGAAGGRAGPGTPRRPARGAATIAATVLAVLAAVVAMALTQPASAAGPAAAAAPNAAASTQRGPDPTVAMIEANRGPFATAQLTVAPGSGFNGGTVYYPTDTGLGTWGALAIVPGYSALFANEEAWMGPWLSSFGFVVIGVETNSRSDDDNARASELLSALTWLTTTSPVKDRVDPNRLSVLGHSAGGAGAIRAAERQPSLRAMIGLAPGFPGNALSMSTDHVPSLVIGGQNDGTVTPSYLSSLYGTLPSDTQSAFAQIAGADHVYYTHANNVEMKILIPWLKVFLDSDTRYTQFLCPTLPDPSSVSEYKPKCPYVPPGGSTGGTTTGGTTTGGTTTGGTTTGGTTTGGTGGSCHVAYTRNEWTGGFTADVVVGNTGTTPVNGWALGFSFPGDQKITSAWNAAVTQSGNTVKATNLSYNSAIAPAGTVDFGFQGTWTSNDTSPSSFTLNGTPCN